jgi:hypothetical protein
VAYLKGLLTAGEVVPAARQCRDRMLARVVAPALQRRLDAAAGDTALPLGVALQLAANVAALLQALQPLDDFLLAQARGETAETAAAAAAAASRSPSPGRRGRSRSSSPVKLGAGAEARGRRRAGHAAGEEAEAGGSRKASPTPRLPGHSSSHASSPSPSGARPAPAMQQQQQQPQPQAGSQQSGHTVLSFTAAGGGPATLARPGGAPSASTAPAGSAAAALQGLLASAEALAVQSAAAGAAAALAAGEQLDWAPEQQQRSTAYSPYIDELIMHLKVLLNLLIVLPTGAAVPMMGWA